MSDGPTSTLPAGPRRIHLAAAASVLTLLVTYGSFVPLEFRSLAWDVAIEQFKDVPYLNLSVYRRADWVANLVLFIPLGFFWLGAIDLDRRSRFATLVSIPILLALLVAMAIGIEFAQQWTARRTVSQNDMLAEGAGAALGLILWLSVGRRFVEFLRGLKRKAASDTEASPTRRLLQLYALGFALYALQPFDFTFSADEIGGQFKDRINLIGGDTITGKIIEQDRYTIRIQLDDGTALRTVSRNSVKRVLPRKVLLQPFSHTYRNPFDAGWQLGSDVLLFIPFGMLFRYRRGVKQTVLRTLAFAAIVAVLIEVAQLFVFSRFLDTTDVFTSLTGAWIGAVLAGAFAIGEPRDAGDQEDTSLARVFAAVAICLLYTVPLAVIMWHPYKLVPNAETFWKQFGQMFGIPFKAYYYAGEFKALSNLMRSLMLFWPVGALLRWGFGHVRDGFAGKRVLVILVAGVMGFVLEAGKAAMQSKHADITDWMIYILGALFGWWLWGMVTRPSTAASQSQVKRDQAAEQTSRTRSI